MAMHPRRFFTAILCCCAIAAAASPREYIVIGNPAAADLYDQYEQSLSAAQKRALPRNMPFEIVEARRTMGDQITQGMRLSHLGTTWYLMLDEKGKVAGLPAEAAAVRYRGCTPSGDTLMVVLKSLPLHDRNPSGTGKTGITIAKGEKVLRLFTYGNSGFYCKPGAPMLFGWSDAPRSAFSAPDKKISSAAPDEYAGLHERIMKRLSDANDRYDALFRFFNATSGQQKAIPHWESGREGTIYRYKLSGSVETIGQLEKSTGIIVRDVDYILMGKPYTASFGDGVITVRPRGPQ